MGSKRLSSASKALHNFTMPCGLRWGSQRILRCMKVNSNGEISAFEHHRSSLFVANIGVVSNDNANTVVSSETANVSILRWNLRNRMAACKAPMVNGFVYGSASGTGGMNTLASASNGLVVDVMKPNLSLLSPRMRSGVATVAMSSFDKKERAKFPVMLKRREIEVDFLPFSGHKPSRRPAQEYPETIIYIVSGVVVDRGYS